MLALGKIRLTTSANGDRQLSPRHDDAPDAPDIRKRGRVHLALKLAGRDRPATASHDAGASRDVIALPVTRTEPVPAPRPAEASSTADAHAVSAAARIEHEILRILESTILGETIEMMFRRRECALGELFDRLNVLEARAMHARLSRATAGDRVAEAFGRMLADRQQRLLAFLADAPRRHARRSTR